MSEDDRLLLMVDDNRADLVLSKIVLADAGLDIPVQTFSLAEQALDFLRREGTKSVGAILLDIRMPRMNGFEFLDAARETLGEELSGISVFLLTTSAHAHDIERAHEYDFVRGYFTKPLTEAQLAEVATVFGKAA